MTILILTKLKTVFRFKEQLDNRKDVLWAAFCNLAMFVQHLYKTLEQNMLLYSVAFSTRGV